MWAYFGILYAVALTLDVAWVMGNVKWGLYTFVKPTQHWVALACLWLFVIFCNALLVTSVVRYSQKRHTPEEVFGIGAFIGFVSYATFNATAVSMFKEWSPRVAVVDTLWGSLLYGAAASLAVVAHHPWRDPNALAEAL